MKPQDRTRAILRSGLPSTQRLSLIAVADYADQHGECWPSQTTLAMNTGYSRRTIGKALAALIEAGILSIIGERSQCRVMRLHANQIPNGSEGGSQRRRSRFATPAKEVRTPALHAKQVRNPCEAGSQPPAKEVRTEATKEATKEATSIADDARQPFLMTSKAKPSKPTKAKRRRKEPAKVEGYQEAIDHWTAITLPWVQAPATRYPWVFQGQNHDGSKIKRWLRAAQGLEHLKLAMNRYVDAVQAGTTWPAGDPPLTRHFDRELARWLAAPPSSSKPEHWMTTGEGVGTIEPPASNVADTSTLTKAAAWLDSGDGAALLFIVRQEFGDDLPAQDYPPRELWLESLVSHPAVVWSELRRRRDQQPVAVIR